MFNKCKIQTECPKMNQQYTEKLISNGPWWWSTGQCARLLIQRSEFKSRRNYSFFSVKIVFKKNETKQKEAVSGPFEKKISNPLAPAGLL